MSEKTNINRTYETPNDTNAVPIAGGVKIYVGTLIGRTPAGFCRLLQAGDVAVGFAKDYIDNTDGADGDVMGEVKALGKIILPVGGLTPVNVGAKLYASDDETFTLADGGNSFVGFIARLEQEDQAVVAFDFLFQENIATAQP